MATSGSCEEKMDGEEPLEEYNLFISKLSREQIEDLSDEEIRELAIERPGHPGQYGFLLNPIFFRSEAHLAETMKALLDRLAKAKG
jgi:hypothetical protein